MIIDICLGDKKRCMNLSFLQGTSQLVCLIIQTPGSITNVFWVLFLFRENAVVKKIKRT